MVNWTNVTDWNGILSAPNENTGSWFWFNILYGIWIIGILLFSVWGFEVALLASSFIALILGLFLVYAGLVAWQWLLTFPAIILIEILYISWISKKT